MACYGCTFFLAVWLYISLHDETFCNKAYSVISSFYSKVVCGQL